MDASKLSKLSLEELQTQLPNRLRSFAERKAARLRWAMDPSSSPPEEHRTLQEVKEAVIQASEYAMDAVKSDDASVLLSKLITKWNTLQNNYVLLSVTLASLLDRTPEEIEDFLFQFKGRI